MTEVDDGLARDGIGQAQAQPLRFSVDHPTRLTQGRSVDPVRQVDGRSDGLKRCDFAGELEVDGGACSTGDTVKLPLNRTSILAVEK
jgi:hypothetical protein